MYDAHLWLLSSAPTRDLNRLRTQGLGWLRRQPSRRALSKQHNNSVCLVAMAPDMSSPLLQVEYGLPNPCFLIIPRLSCLSSNLITSSPLSSLEGDRLGR